MRKMLVMGIGNPILAVYLAGIEAVEASKSTPVLAVTQADNLKSMLMAGYKLFPEEKPGFLQINLIEVDIADEFFDDNSNILRLSRSF